MHLTHLQRFLGAAALALLGTTSAAGQARPTNPGTGAGNTTTTPTTPTSPNPNTRTTLPSTQQPGMASPDMQRPMFLSGKVMLDDGTPPPDSVRIERVCGSRIIPEQMTDRKGRFSFELGRNVSTMMDASDSGAGMRAGMPPGTSNSPSNPFGGIRERDLMNCELRAVMPGYRSDVVNLASRKFMDNPDVGTIILHRLGNVEGLTISGTSLNAPKDARKAFDKGHEALTKNKLDDAQKNLEKAVEIYPKYAVAWYDLGVTSERRHNTEEARKAFNQALTADPKYINPYDGLAQIAARERKWDDVVEITDKMIRLNPVDFPQAYFFNAVGNLNLSRLDPAEKSAKELIHMDSRHQIPRAEHVLGVILLNKQDYSGAAAHLRKYVETSQPGPEVDSAKKQLENLEKALAAREQQQPRP